MLAPGNDPRKVCYCQFRKVLEYSAKKLSFIFEDDGNHGRSRKLKCRSVKNHSCFTA